MNVTKTGVTLAVASGLVLLAGGRHVDQCWSDLRGDDFPAAMTALLALSLLLLAAWVLLVVTAATVPHCSQMARAITPRVMRGVLVAGTAAALTTTPAHADPPDRSLDGLRLPDRPVVAAAVSSPASTDVVVQPGDTLWAIAAAHLDDPSEAATAVAVQRWFSTNRGVIGPNPDLIHPGQHLRPPEENRS